MRTLILTLSLLSFAARVPAGIVTPGSTVGGKTIAEWGGEWWKWGMSFPAAAGPFTDLTGAYGHLGNVGGPVFFVNAAAGGAPLEYTIYNPVGQYLLFPMLTGLYTLSPGETDQEALDALPAFINAITGIYATIDGVPIPNPFTYEELTDFFYYVVPQDGLDVPGTYRALAVGYWVMLEPLGPGTHTLSFGGEVPDFGFSAATTVTINPVPEPGTLSLGVLALVGAWIWRRSR